MSSVKVIKMNSSTAIPIIGLGAWAPPNPEAAKEAKNWILSALKCGYRHIDTALSYGTEKAVGDAIRESGIDRETIYVTTKLPWNHHGRVLESMEESLKNLGLPWVDLYLMHWPICMEYDANTFDPKHPDGSPKVTEDVTFIQSWEVMCSLTARGKCEAVGVSNFSIKCLEELLAHTRHVPCCNQVEMHPYLAQNDLRAYCQEKGIVMVAYTPSGYDIVRKDPVIVEIAAKHKVTSNQVILAWHNARDTVVIPKSSKLEHQIENLTLPTLDEEDMVKINSLDRGLRLCNKVDEKDEVFGWPRERMGW
ncbi:NADP-dependent oxidoreductase domain-containing protein [Mycena floridula]|nr:NADP-dependent oxidoreductase domain-containing protein [Mycena floridula]